MSSPRLLDVRRLTGPSVVQQHPGAVLDLACSPGPATEALLASFEAHLARMGAALAWPLPTPVRHWQIGGLSLAIAASMDRLYAATEVLAWAWRAAAGDHQVEADPDDTLDTDVPLAFDEARGALAEAMVEEANPRLLALLDAAAERGVVALADDDLVSLGHGRNSRSWPLSDLPDPDAVPWEALASIPVGLVTGTNGKTTSVRMVTSMARAAGLGVGFSSTDGVFVDDRTVDGGDYSGPGGARLVLRQPDVDLAVLETARGGLLRRGLGLASADAVLVTNIAEDHLGDFGSRSLDELLDVKWVVTRALGAGGCAVLNADDPRLVQRAADLVARGVHLIWFSPDADQALLARHRAAGGTVLTVVDGVMVRQAGSASVELCAVAQVPLTLGGRARHNVANALGALALGGALGLPDAAMAAGLRGMGVNDNPGRCNIFDVGGVQVLVDFAHNPEGVRAILELAASQTAQRRLVALSQPGDRTDGLVRDVAGAVATLGPDRVLVSELAEFHRGRRRGEIFDLMRARLLAEGLGEDRIGHHELETDALEDALAWARPGDLLVMLVLGQRREVLSRLQDLAGTGAG